MAHARDDGGSGWGARHSPELIGKQKAPDAFVAIRGLAC